MPNEATSGLETLGQIAERICVETIESAKAWSAEHKRFPSRDELAELLKPIREREERGMSAEMAAALGDEFGRTFPALLRRHAQALLRKGGPRGTG